MALQQKREERTEGQYSLVVWDDRFGHAVIWEYDARDQLQRLGVVTHTVGGAPDGGSSQVIWHDA